jgi:hypothetical protein
MATYVALDLFYSNLFDVDPETITEKTETNDTAKSNPTKVLISDEKRVQE